MSPRRALLGRVALAVLLGGAILALLWAGVWRTMGDTLALHVGKHELELLAPRWLALLAALPLLWLAQAGTLVDLSLPQRVLSLAVRGSLLLLLALALARPALPLSEERVCTVFVVDVSRSVSGDQLAWAQRRVDEAWAARGKESTMRLLTFDGQPRAVPLDASAQRPPRLVRHGNGPHTEQSDIQGALQYAAGLFPAGYLRRMVLITDGNETRGDLLAEAYRAASRGVRLHVHPLPDRKQREVLVRSLTGPREVRIGAPFDLTAEVYATHEERVTLTLHKDRYINALDGKKEVTLEPGKNRFSFKTIVRQPGTVSYRLAMTGAKRDTWAGNNRAEALLPVLGRPRVLYVEGEPAHATPLRRALEAERIDVTVRGPHGLPGSAVALSKFDLVLVSDVPAMYLGPGHMAALTTYVRDLGGGFVMTGGPNSLGAGGYYGTTLERLLPVRLDTEKKRDQPSLGLVLCIDRSGSMRGAKLELAKEAARATAELLGRTDLIGVVAFDSSAQVLVRLQRAANKLRILSDISRLTHGGGTSIRPALREAYSQLRLARAKVKHVILLSDGQSSYGGIPQLVEEMAQSRITVSAVGVGGGADRTLLQMIAERGGGRFYHTDDPRNVPKIFTKETTQVARSSVVEEPIRAHVAKRASVLSGIDWGSAPALRGYVSTKAKPTAETLLVSQYGEPLLAMWRVGLGKAAVFTSDVKSRWAAAWLPWRGYQQLFSQVVREVMRHRIRQAMDMTTTVRHGVVSVAVDAVDGADRFINGLSGQLTALDPTRPGRKHTYPLWQTAAGRYEARLRLPDHGAWLLRATLKADDERKGEKVVAESLGSISAPYPEEYTHLVPDRARVVRAARAAGGRVSPTAAQAFAADGASIRHRRDLWPMVLYLLLGLFVLDVLLRRVRIFGYRGDA